MSFQDQSDIYLDEVTFDTLSISEEEDNKENEAEVIPIPEYFRLDESKEFLNVIMVGTTNAGKTTLFEKITMLAGIVRTQEVDKEFARRYPPGVETVECHFTWSETQKKHYSFIDAPGSKIYLPKMIFGSSQSDIAILMISAIKEEFDKDFENGGQTQEHTMIVKSSGVKKLIVLINKMDDLSVHWSFDRYNECKDQLTQFLNTTGFNLETDVHFMPCSCLEGFFLDSPAPESVCPFYRSPCLLDYLDNLPPLERHISGPLRITVSDVVFDETERDICGKLESGWLTKNQTIMAMPGDRKIEISKIMLDDDESEMAYAGHNIMMLVNEIEREAIGTGSVLCSLNNLCPVSNMFDAKVDVCDFGSIVSAGFEGVMHVHSLVIVVSINRILAILDNNYNMNGFNPRRPYLTRGDRAIVRFKVKDISIAIEKFKDFPKLGRFMLRKGFELVALGEIKRIFPI